jgi:autotransporter-associated beta strand protein
VDNATFAVNRSNTVTQGTDFNGAGISGTGGLTQVGGTGGTGTLNLNAANTYTGTTRPAGGTLHIGHNQAIQNSTLDMRTGDTGAVEFDNSLSGVTMAQITGSRNLALLKANGSALAVSITGVTTPVAHTGALSGNGSSVTMVGSGTQILSGANTYTGNTTINGGILEFGQTVAMPAASASPAGDYNGNGTVDAADYVLQRKNGLNYNTWRSNFGATGGSGGGGVTVNSGGTLAVSAGGTGDWTNNSIDQSTPGTLASLIKGKGGQTGSTVTWTSGSAMGIDVSNAPLNGTVHELTYDGAIGGFTPAGNLNNVGLTKRGIGRLISTANNTFTGPIVVTNGGVGAADDEEHRSILVLQGSNLLAGSSMAVPTVQLDSNTKLLLGASNLLNPGSVIHTNGGRGRFTLDDGTTAVTQTVRSIYGTNGLIEVGSGKLFINDLATDNYVYGSPSGALILTNTSGANGYDFTKGTVDKIGAGTLDLVCDTSNGGFNGTFIMEAGTLKLSRSESVGSSTTSRLVVKGGQLARTSAGSAFTYSVGNLDLYVFKYDLSDDPTVGSQFSATTITSLKQADVVFNITNGGTQTPSSGRFVFLGAIKNNDTSPNSGDTSEARGITKTGNGVLSLQAANTYKGPTTVQDGVLLMTTTSTTLGDTTQATAILNLKGGMLATTTANGTETVANPVVVNSSAGTGGTVAVGAFSTAASANTVIDFTSSDITYASGSMTIANANTNNNSNTISQARFSGQGFSTAMPIVITNAANVGTGVKSSELGLANTTGTQTFSGAISGTGGVRRLQAGGISVLSGNNTYSGATTIDAGTLLLNGANTGGGAVTINSGGTLGGTGSTTSAVTVASGGTFAPGPITAGPVNGIGAFATGALSVAGTFAAELDSTASTSVGADLLNLNGNLTLTGSTLNLSDIAGTSTLLGAGTKFTLISYSGTWINSDTFSGIADGGTVTAGANTFTIDYNDTTPGANFGGGSYSNYVTLTASGAGSGSSVSGAAVPEPGSLSLMIFAIGSALVSCSSRLRRRCKV